MGSKPRGNYVDTGKMLILRLEEGRTPESLLSHAMTGPGARLGERNTEGILREANGYLHLCDCNQEADNEAKN